jgi:hypothetical protein
MNDRRTIELRAEHVRYYSDNDEAAFFDWLGKIKCITKTGGHGYTLTMTVQPDLVGQDELRELLGLFHRYHIEKSQLGTLVPPEFSSWFHDKQKYWNADESSRSSDLAE